MPSICLQGFERQVLSLSFPFLELNASPVGNCGLVPGHHFLIRSHCHEHCFVYIKGRPIAFALYGQNWECVSQSASKTATRAFSLFKIWSVSLIWFLFFFHVNPVDSVMMVNWKRFISSCLSLFVFCVLLVSLFFVRFFYTTRKTRSVSNVTRTSSQKETQNGR